MGSLEALVSVDGVTKAEDPNRWLMGSLKLKRQMMLMVSFKVVSWCRCNSRTSQIAVHGFMWRHNSRRPQLAGDGFMKGPDVS